METENALATLPDDELLRRLAVLLQKSRRTEADLVSHIGEADRRQLYLREASPSMFAYCTERLHLSEAEAYLRIAAARASREHPVLLEMLADGRLHLTAVAKLAPHLTVENREGLLGRAAHKSKREVEELVAEIAPRSDARAWVRKLPERRGNAVRERGEGTGLQLRPDAVASAEGQSVSAEGQSVSAEGQSASARVVSPAGDEPSTADGRIPEPGRPDPATKGLPSAETSAEPAPAASRRTVTRHVPAAVRRAVYERDGGRCTWSDGKGRRCTARVGLEFHHRHPFARGGEHSVAEVGLLCRARNLYLAEVDFGREVVAEHRRARTAAFRRAEPESS